MSKSALTLLIFLFRITASTGQTYHTRSFSMTINDAGQVTSLQKGGVEMTPSSSPGSLLQIVANGKTASPLKARFSREKISLSFPDGLTADIKVREEQTYLVLTLAAVSDGVDAIKWGPFNTTIADTIGNTVGVVRSSAIAIGLQALNKKTSGGVLVNEEGAVLERGTTATAQSFGSSLQAFSVRRNRDRVIKVWDHWPNVPVKAIPDGGLEGSSIALFGCAPGDVLPLLRSITEKEKLPFASWKGEWIKTSAGSGRPYMITTFSESNIDTFLNLAKRMGMAGVYHEDPFDTWGHFVLKQSLFPHGRKGFKACVDKAHHLGLRLGFHTLTTFITTNDSFVTPRPDPRLAQAGGAVLLSGISPDATEIAVDTDAGFRLQSDLNSVRIGEEIIRFREVSKSPPYRLVGCMRGAFGTVKTAHKANDRVVRLIDHPYKVFFPDWSLQKEIAANIARFINETGADQMDFDGHEGTYACGMGDLSFDSFAEEVFRQADHPVVFGSSRDNHYFWHFNNYLNWGEPWYGGFRESQSDLRMANQHFYESNYMPNMLGWFLITLQTSPDDIDWMLARAAGFNAGYALVVRQEALGNPHMEEIADRINTWTLAQQRHLFTAAQLLWLRDPNIDARLDNREGKLYLQHFRKYTFAYEARVLQPGQPGSQHWDFDNASDQQVPQLLIHGAGEDGRMTNPVIEVDNSFHLEIPVTIEAGQTLVVGGEKMSSLYDRKGKLIRTIAISDGLPRLGADKHTLSFDGTADLNSPIKLKIEIKLLDAEDVLR